jgi:uncharacterized protein (DUF952 family)
MTEHKFIYHITLRQAWETSDSAAGYQPSSLALEGFIHASLLDQVLSTANRYFRSVTDDLVLLVIKTSSLADALRLEPAVPMRPELQDVLFPHVYRPLYPDDVEEVRPFARNSDGEFSF